MKTFSLLSKSLLLSVLFLFFGFKSAAQSDNLLLQYDFEENINNLISDQSGNNNHAQVFGSPQLVTGQSGNAMVFSDYNNYLLLPENLCAQMTSFTIATWIKMDYKTNWSRIFDFGSGTSTYLFLSPQSGYGDFRFAMKNSNSAEQVVSSSESLKLGVWTHIALTFNWNAANSMGEGKLYVNGVLVGTNSNFTINPAMFRRSDQNYIAKSQFTADPALFGSLDDFRVYNKALSNEEILSMTGYSEILIQAFNNLSLKVNPLQVISDIELPSTQDGLKVEWSSNNTDIISNEGTVTRPSLFDSEVTLTATLIYNDGLKETRLSKYFVMTVLASNPNPSHWESMVLESEDWKYLVATSEPATGWNMEGFEDSSWKVGPGGFGFSDGDDQTVLTACNSVYLRKKVQIEDLSKIEDLILDIDYDDAFVLYINGVERARSTNIIGTLPAFNATLTTDHEAKMYSGGSAERFQLKPSFLLTGENTIAVQVLNVGLSSSDLSARVFIHAKVLSDTVIYNNTPDWFTVPISFESSNLPFIMIETNGQTIIQNSKIMADMKVINNIGTVNYISDSIYEYNGKIGIEIRGNTSTMFPKKSYTVETRVDDTTDVNVPLLGMPKENDWVFHGPYSDKSLMRNVLAYNLGNKTGKWSPRTQYFELYLNGIYQGIYVLVEKIKIDKNRLNLSTLNPADTIGDQLTGGYVLKIDRPEVTEIENVDYWWSPYKAWTNLQQSVPFILHDPNGVDLQAQQVAYIRDYITRFEDAMFSDDYQNREIGYYPFIDLQSFVDYYIITELSRNLDGYRISTFLYKDKDSKGGKLTMGPFWDYNICFGNANFFAAGNTSGWVIDGMGDADQYAMPFWWEKLRLDPFFNSHLKNRWNEVKEDFINTTYINNLIDSCAYDLRDAVERNFSTWNILNTYVWPNNYVGGSYGNELNYLKSWMRDRIEWMDAQIQPIVDVTVGTDLIQTLPMELVAYPNPFVEQLNLKFYLNSNSDFKVDIFDLMGRLVYSHSEFIWSGLHTIQIPVESLQSASNVYIYKVSVDNQIRKTGKLIQSK